MTDSFWGLLTSPNELDAIEFIVGTIALMIAAVWAVYRFRKQRTRHGAASSRNSGNASKPTPTLVSQPTSRSIYRSYTVNNIPPDLHLLVEQRIESGRFHSRSAYIRKLLWEDVRMNAKQAGSDTGMVSILKPSAKRGFAPNKSKRDRR